MATVTLYLVVVATFKGGTSAATKAAEEAKKYKDSYVVGIDGPADAAKIVYLEKGEN